mgnify:CR=1 FL=1|tara:strand:+ start:341 stop:553 length:213 start_codon:yes stop_codon:yes gene_type:complete
MVQFVSSVLLFDVVYVMTPVKHLMNEIAIYISNEDLRKVLPHNFFNNGSNVGSFQLDADWTSLRKMTRIS